MWFCILLEIIFRFSTHPFGIWNAVEHENVKSSVVGKEFYLCTPPIDT